VISLRLALEGADLKAFQHQTHLRLARGARNAAELIATRAKLRLRQDVLAGGLGQKVANTWRADIYPKSATVRTHAPAVQIYTKAPLIVRAFSQATTIKSKNGIFLAIPTENTPRKGRRLATPVEVEAMFNQDLIFIHGRGQQMLAFVDAIKAKSGKGFRKATKKRTKDGRQNELVLMFVMVRQTRLKKRLNTQRIFADLSRDWLQIFAQETTKALSAGSN
jgi:hypothetical protein